VTFAILRGRAFSVIAGLDPASPVKERTVLIRIDRQSRISCAAGGAECLDFAERNSFHSSAEKARRME
jgi:hypothetical protein